jgi:hypothetical protein
MRYTCTLWAIEYLYRGVLKSIVHKSFKTNIKIFINFDQWNQQVLSFKRHAWIHSSSKIWKPRPLGIQIVYGICFKKVDHINWKIVAFEAKKRAFFAPFKMRSIDFHSSWLKNFFITQSWGFWYYVRKLSWKSFKNL